MVQYKDPLLVDGKTPRASLNAIHLIEDFLVCSVLILMALVPFVEMVGRKWFGAGIPGAVEYLRHMTLWIGFLGAMAATWKHKHLKMAALDERLKGRSRAVVQALVGLVSATVCFGLFGASVQLVVSEAPAVPVWVGQWIPDYLETWLSDFGLYESWNTKLVAGWIPIWAAEVIMPLGFLVMGLRSILHAGTGWGSRFLAFLSVPLMLSMPFVLQAHAASLVMPGILVLLVATICGAPIFVLLGGSALLLFWGDMTPVAAIPAETYRIVASPIFPTIPLFTLAGFILSESRASDRLVKVFQTCFGALPGGMAVATTLACAFFTTFTGASGVTILALGGVLMPVLVKSRYPESFSVGLLASSGSLGLLLPPSLVVILFAVFAHVPVTDMFLAGLVPGNLLIIPVVLYCLVYARRQKLARQPFDRKAALKAILEAKWELVMPALVLFLIFGGICTMVEAAAVLVLYALVIEGLVYRDFRPLDLCRMFSKCGTLVGAVLIILGVAMGLTNYLVDADVPVLAADWVSTHIQNKWVFLIALNIALVLAGCVMDIYSALVVVVPIILPISESYGIDPMHLGVIFLANLQLGYLTPPVGMNLFLASMRFEKPVSYVSKVVLPFLLIFIGVVLLVTFVPAISTGVVELTR